MSAKPLLSSPQLPAKVTPADLLRRNFVAAIATAHLVLFRGVSFACLAFLGVPSLEGKLNVLVALLTFASLVAQLSYVAFKMGLGTDKAQAGRQMQVIACASSTVASLNASMSKTIAGSGARPESQPATAIAVMSLCSIVTGACIVLLSLRLDKTALARGKSTISLPLLYAYFAVIGFEMCQGAVDVASKGNAPKHPGSLVEQLSLGSASSLLPQALAVVCGLTMRVASTYLGGRALLYIMPAILLVAVPALLTASEELRAPWVFPRVERVSFAELGDTFSQLSLGEAVDGFALSAPILCAMVPIMVLDLVTNILPMEKLQNSPMDLKKEMTVGGVQILLASACGGSASYMSLSPSRLFVELGGVEDWEIEQLRQRQRSRSAQREFALLSVQLMPGCLNALVLFAWLTVFLPFLSYVPRFFVAALLFHLGLGYIKDGVNNTLSRLGRGEQAVALIMMIAGVYTNFVMALLIGLAAAAVLVVLTYAGNEGNIVAAARFVTAGDRSKTVRAGPDRAALAEHRRRLMFVKVSSNALHFANVAAVVGAGQGLIAQAVDGSPQAQSEAQNLYLVLDLTSVITIDSSAAEQLALLSEPPLTPLFACTSALAAAALRKQHLRVHSSTEAAFHFCEDALLRFANLSRVDVKHPGQLPQSNAAHLAHKYKDSTKSEKPSKQQLLVKAFGPQCSTLAAFATFKDVPQHTCLGQFPFDGACVLVVEGEVHQVPSQSRQMLRGPGEFAADPLLARLVGDGTPGLGAKSAQVVPRSYELSPKALQIRKTGEILPVEAMFRSTVLRSTSNLTWVTGRFCTFLLLPRDQLTLAEVREPRAVCALYKSLGESLVMGSTAPARFDPPGTA